MTTSTKPSVLLLGGSGYLGGYLLTALHTSRSSFSRVAVLTTSPTFVSPYPSTIPVLYTSALHPTSYSGFTHVISSVGNATIRLQPAMIEAAATAGVQEFFPSEFGTDISQPELVGHRYFRDKVVTRDHLAAAAKAGKIRGTYVVCGVFTEWAATEAFGVDLEVGRARLYTSNSEKRNSEKKMVSVTAAPDVARVVVESIINLPWTEVELKKGVRTVKVVGEELGWQELVELAAIEAGKEVEFQQLDLQQAKQQQEEARISGDETKEMEWALKPGAGNGWARVKGPLDNERVGFKLESVKETYARVAKAN